MSFYFNMSKISYGLVEYNVSSNLQQLCQLWLKDQTREVVPKIKQDKASGIKDQWFLLRMLA